MDKIVRGGWRVAAFKVLVCVAAAYWLWQYILEITPHLRPGFVAAGGEQLGQDFVNAWSTPRMAAVGRAFAAYSPHDLTVFQRALTAPNAQPKVYFYPPVNMLLTAPFAVFSFIVAYVAWTAVGLVAPAALLAQRLGWLWATVAVLATPAEFLNAITGQNGAYTVLLLGGGLMLLERRPICAGVLLGLMCYKPQLALMIPVALLAGGRWRAILAAAATAAALVLLSALLLGWSAWAGFLHDEPLRQNLLQVRTFWRRMPTLYAACRLLGASNAGAYFAQFVCALATAAAVFAVWRRPGPVIGVKGAAVLAGTFLATPYAWDYDMVVLLLAAVWVWDSAAAGGWRTWAAAPLLAMLLIPGALMVVPVGAYRLQAEPFALAGLLLVLLVKGRPAATAVVPAATGRRSDFRDAQPARELAA